MAECYLGIGNQFLKYLLSVSSRSKAIFKYKLSLLFNTGPLIGFPVIDMQISLTNLNLSPGTAPAMVSACASQCLHSALNAGGSQLLEPMMNLEVKITCSLLS